MFKPDTAVQSLIRHSVSAVLLTKNGFVVSGFAYRDGESNDRAGFQAVLRSRSGNREYMLSASRTVTPDEAGPEAKKAYPNSGFDITLHPGEIADGAPLRAGLWDLWLAITVGEETQTVRLGNHRSGSVDTSPRVVQRTLEGTPHTVVGHFSDTDGGFSLDAEGIAHPAEVLSRRVRTRWESGRGATLILEVPDWAAKSSVADVSFKAVTNDRVRVSSPAVPDGSNGLRSQLQFDERGDWHINVTVKVGNGIVEVPVYAQKSLAPRRWRKTISIWYAKSHRTADSRLVIRVAQVSILRGLLRRLRS